MGAMIAPAPQARPPAPTATVYGVNFTVITSPSRIT
jgi:hypothetical protein